MNDVLKKIDKVQLMFIQMSYKEVITVDIRYTKMKGTCKIRNGTIVIEQKEMESEFTKTKLML